MKTLLKVLAVTVILVVLVVAGALAWFYARGADTMLSKITAAAQGAGYEMTVEQTTVGLLPPRWIWKNFSLKSQDQSLLLHQDLLSLTTKWNLKGLWTDVPFVQIGIHLEQPQLTVQFKEEAPEAAQRPATEPAAAPAFLPPVDVGVSLSLKNGSLTWSRPGQESSSIEQFHLAVQLPSVKKALIHASSLENDGADVRGNLQMSAPFIGPVQALFEAGLAKNKVIIPSAQIQALGVQAQARGWMNYASGEQSWSVRASAENLSGLSGTELPARFHSGQLQLILDAHKEKDADWSAKLDFQAKDLRGISTYQTDELVSEGDFIIQAGLKARYESGEIEIPPFQLSVDFSGTNIRYGDFFEKPKGTPAVLQLKGSHQNSRVQIESLALQVGETSLRATGAITSVPEDPQLQLSLNVPATEAKSIKALVPMLRDYPYTGSLLAQVQVQGPAFSPEKLAVHLNPLKLSNIRGGVNFKTEDGKASAAGNFSASGELIARTLFKGLKSAQGNLTADLGDVELKWDNLAAKPKGVPLKITLNGQMGSLPKNQNVLQAVNARYQLSLGQLHYDGLTFSGLSTQGSLKDGQAQGEARIQSAFGGVVQAKSFSANLKTEPMRIQSEVSTQGVDVQKLTAWVAPEWKESVGGKLQSTVKLQTVFPVPEKVSIMKAMAGAGQFKISEFFLKSGQINQMIHKKLESLSGLGKKVQLKEQTVHATVDGRFSLSKGVMSLPNLKMVTTQNDEIRLEGQMLSDLKLNLKGVAHLHNPPIRGTVLAANSDKEGRLVLPLAIEGTLTDPSPQILQTTVQTLLENTVKYELKQQSKKVETEVKDTLEKEAKKLLEGLFK